MSLHKLLRRFCEQYRDLLLLWNCQALEVHLLIKPVTCQPGVAPLFVLSVVALCTGASLLTDNGKMSEAETKYQR